MYSPEDMTASLLTHLQLCRWGRRGNHVTLNSHVHAKSKELRPVLRTEDIVAKQVEHDVPLQSDGHCKKGNPSFR